MKNKKKKEKKKLQLLSVFVNGLDFDFVGFVGFVFCFLVGVGVQFLSEQ